MPSHVPRSRYIDPGRPPAADGGLRSQYPDLVLGAQQPLDCRQLRQAVRRVSTRSFDTRSKASIDSVLSISRDFPGFLIVLILKTSGMG